MTEWVLKYWYNSYRGTCKIVSPLSTYHNESYYGWTISVVEERCVKADRVYKKRRPTEQNAWYSPPGGPLFTITFADKEKDDIVQVVDTSVLSSFASTAEVTAGAKSPYFNEKKRTEFENMEGRPAKKQKLDNTYSFQPQSVIKPSNAILTKRPLTFIKKQ